MNDLPIVFAPGLNCTAALFQPQQAHWADRETYIIDHSQDESMASIAARFLAKAPARFNLVGLSMGGYIALEILAQAQDRVARLALLDTRSSPDTSEDAERRKRLIALAEGGRFEDVHGILWPRLVHPNRVADAALEKIVVGMMADTGAQVFVRQQKAVLTRRDYRPLLATITCPTLVLVGDADVITPPVYAEEIARGIAGSELSIIADCGHLSTLEQPSAVNAALEQWLRRALHPST